MTLLAPIALAFAALLAVPVIVHLFKPRRVRQTPFSSLRWLALSPQKLSRRIRPHQLLLFALRAGFLLLLVFALALPLWSRGEARVAGERVIVLDVSRSMAVRIPGRPVPIERGREIAAGLVESAPPGTRTTVLLVSTTARRLGTPDRDASALLPELRRVEATAADTSLCVALPLAKPLLSRSDRPGELIFITDNLQGAWDADSITAFANATPGTRVRVIDVGHGAVPNAWIASARIVEVGEPMRRLLRIELAASVEAQDRTLRVSGIPGEGEAVRAVPLDPGRPTVLHLELPADADLRGMTAKLSLEPPDALPDDDEFFVSLDPRSALRVLLIAPETGAEATRPGFPLRQAMKALSDTGARTVRVTLRSPAIVSAGDVNANDMVLLADVPELPESVVTALDQRMRSGAGLGVFIGPRVKTEWYNQNFARPLQPAAGLLPVTLGAVVNAPERVPWMLPARQHALLAGLGDPLVGDLADVSSQKYLRLTLTEQLPAGAAVGAKTPDGTPLLVEHHAGAGTVLLVNASADSSFSDFHASKIFVPFVDRMLASLGHCRGRAFTAGEPVAFAVEGAKAGDRLTLIGPGEERRAASVRREGGNALLELGTLDLPGAYRVEGAGEPVAFTVNAGRGDSAMSPLDPEVLRTWWRPLECSVEAASGSDTAMPVKSAFPLWPALLVAAALVLMIETLAAGWLCPRLTPPATTSLLQKQRLNTREADRH
jgi:hypothetical protein